MSTSEAQHAANKANAAHSTGPKTQTGKVRSSKNRLTFGLFTISDFVREDESESYTKICTSLWSELSPAGTIEEAFTTEIMSATWRLRRCRMVEEDISGIAILDPMQDPETAAQQKSVDRARAQSVNIMNRCINALRKLQTERGIRSQAFPETDAPDGLGLMDLRQVAKTKPMDTDAEPTPAAAAPAATPAGFDVLMALADKQLAQRYRDYGMAAFTGEPAAPAPPCSPKNDSDLIRTEAQSQTSPTSSSPKHVSDLIRAEAQSQTSPTSSSPKHVSDLIRAEAQSQPNNLWSMASNCKPPVGQVSDLPSSPKHVPDLIRTQAQSQPNNLWSMASNCKPAPTPTPAPAKSAAPPRNTPRNALCPCKSGQKFKRCCGKELPRTRFSDLIRSEAR